MKRKLVLLIFSISLVVSAHPGRTDAYGGHRDNRNVSGLGYYHYHHGYSAHLHPNGICPYEAPKKKTKTEVINKLETLGYSGKNAVINFQRDNNLKPDGIVGKRTMHKINELLKNGGF